jgi:hypothetical protein
VTGPGAPPGGGHGFGPPPGSGYGFGPPPGSGHGFGPPPAGGHGFGAPPGSPGYELTAAPEHEFGGPENEVIATTAKWARTLGVVMLVYSGLSLFGCGIQNTVAYVAFGIPLMMASSALQRVVDTRGRDVSTLMQAMQSLGTAFLVRIIVLAATVALTVLLVVLIAVFALSVAATNGSR